MGRPSKVLTRDQIEAAHRKTPSCRAAARYLGVSYPHYKRYAKLFTDEESGKTLFELQKNPSGKGIPKFLSGKSGEPSLIDIIEGRASPLSFTPKRVKERLIAEHILEECCSNCGYEERRVVDYKMPLLLHFKDDNTKNYMLANIELLCYNCFFIYVGDVFTNRQIKGLEDHISIYKTDSVDWEISDYHKQQLEKINQLNNEENSEDSLISRI